MLYIQGLTWLQLALKHIVFLHVGWAEQISAFKLFEAVSMINFLADIWLSISVLQPLAKHQSQLTDIVCSPFSVNFLSLLLTY